jgi:hypothetical protein
MCLVSKCVPVLDESLFYHSLGFIVLKAVCMFETMGYTGPTMQFYIPKTLQYFYVIIINVLHMNLDSYI